MRSSVEGDLEFFMEIKKEKEINGDFIFGYSKSS